jgi:hypothetical protein
MSTLWGRLVAIVGSRIGIVALCNVKLGIRHSGRLEFTATDACELLLLASTAEVLDQVWRCLALKRVFAGAHEPRQSVDVCGKERNERLVVLIVGYTSINSK